MIFTDRSDAGRQLAEVLATEPLVADAPRRVVLAVPRGGLPVGVEVARRLGAPLDVAVSRALRAPHDPEVTFGSVGSDGHVEIDEEITERLALTEEEVRAEVEHRRRRVERRLAVYRGVLEPVDVARVVAVVVDDGVASGGTARRACSLARRAGAERVVLGVPVAPRGAAADLGSVADRVVVLTEPAEFLAVGQAYQDFPQLTDDDMLAALAPQAIES